MAEEKKSVPCGCGRSPTGSCIGWHGLTNEQYQEKLAEYQKKQLNESAPKFLNGQNIRGVGIDRCALAFQARQDRSVTGTPLHF